MLRPTKRTRFIIKHPKYFENIKFLLILQRIGNSICFCSLFKERNQLFELEFLLINFWFFYIFIYDDILIEYSVSVIQMFFKCHYDSILTIRLFLVNKSYRNVEKLSYTKKVMRTIFITQILYK